MDVKYRTTLTTSRIFRVGKTGTGHTTKKLFVSCDFGLRPALSFAAWAVSLVSQLRSKCLRSFFCCNIQSISTLLNCWLSSKSAARPSFSVPTSASQQKLDGFTIAMDFVNFVQGAGRIRQEKIVKDLPTAEASLAHPAI